MPPALDRLARLLPALRALVDRVAWLAWISAGAALLLGLLVLGSLGVSGPRLLVALVTMGVLLLPALGTALGVRLVRSLLSLPETLRAEARVITEPGPASARLLGFVPLLLRLRGVLAAARGSVGKAAVFGRAARLASLPLVLGFALAFVLNFVVIGLAVLGVVAFAARSLLI